MGKDFVIIMITCATRKEAQKIANRLLTKKLVACAHIISDIESRFWWKGKIDYAKEALVTMKTRKTNFKKIENEVKKLHSYEVPEIIALPIIDGSKDYLNWIAENT